MLILKTFCQEKSQNENVRFRKKDEWILNNHVKKEVFGTKMMLPFCDYSILSSQKLNF